MELKKEFRKAVVFTVIAVVMTGCTSDAVKKETTAKTAAVKSGVEKVSESFIVKGEGNELRTLKLKETGGGIFEVKSEMAPGSYEFVIQDGSGKLYKCEKIIGVNEEVSLVVTEKKEKSLLFIRNTVKYLFRIKKEGEGKYSMKVMEAAGAKGDITMPVKYDGKIDSIGESAFVVKKEEGRYDLYSTVTQRDFNTKGNKREIEEKEGKMVLRSGNTMFDSLFALAIDDALLNSVSEITDGSFNNGKPVPINAFQTGEAWHYVWTRDTAYSVALSLAYFDPVRSMNSLGYKMSAKREKTGEGINNGPEIVQDTGSGGSWPISSDRVTWALGAWETLKYLDGAERKKFFDDSYEAIVNTVENDRKAVFDKRDGLYRGEQSFLDWREQTYPIWTESDTAHVGMSKTLSTNAAHCAILTIASKMAEEIGKKDEAAKYKSWSEELKAAVNKEFWLENKGLYSSMKTTEIDNRAVEKYDALGEALAVITGIADEKRSKTVVASYPHVEAGPPVIWPQLPGVPPYHNRAIWPFVTSFTVKAAKIAKNTAVYDHDIKAMMNASALNLSNMENYEFLSGRHSYTDKYNGAGPVINSRRQLWSVGGYISVVVDGLFGLESTNDSIRFAPFITTAIRNEILGDAKEITLRNFIYKGKIIDVTVELPAEKEAAGKYYTIDKVLLNGVDIGDKYITKAMLDNKNKIVIKLGKTTAGDTAINNADIKDFRDMSKEDYRKLFVPKEPKIQITKESDGKTTLTIDANKEADVVFNIYKNGKPAAKGVKENKWRDPEPANEGERLSFTVNNGTIKSEGSVIAEAAGKKYFAKWGKPAEKITIGEVKPAKSGEYYITTKYANANNSVNTGITACVKWVEVKESATGKTAGEGIVTMPHLDSWKTWGDSTLLPVNLEAGKSYNIEIRDFYNMTYFKHFAIYGGEGGTGGAVNNANISGVEIFGGADYYTVESEYTDSGNKSHISIPKCVK